jgi:integrase
VLRLPDTKSGALLVSLGEPAIEVLNDLKVTQADETFVIVGKRKNAHLVNLQKPWRLVRELAELEDVRLHDLRHTFASVGAGMGLSLHMLGRLLGHKQAATTTRYAHLAQDPVRTAADAIGLELLRLANFEQPMEPKEVKKGQ